METFTLEAKLIVKPEAYWNWLLSDAWIADWARETRMQKYDLLERTDAGEYELVRIDMVPRLRIPAAYKPLLGGKNFGAVEVHKKFYEGYRVVWSSENNFVSEKRAPNGGELYLEKRGRAWWRIYTGEVGVKIPVVGNKVEKEIVRGLVRSFDFQTKFIEEFCPR